MLLIAQSEGLIFAYEVTEHPDGYLVRMRDLATGAVDDDCATLFRTVAVAVRFAELAASTDRFAIEAAAGVEEVAERTEMEGLRRRFEDARVRSGDAGLGGALLARRDRDADLAERRRLH